VNTGIAVYVEITMSENGSSSCLDPMTIPRYASSAIQGSYPSLDASARATRWVIHVYTAYATVALFQVQRRAASYRSQVTGVSETESEGEHHHIIVVVLIPFGDGEARIDDGHEPGVNEGHNFVGVAIVNLGLPAWLWQWEARGAN
jgi:hypothetical protein